VRRLIVLAAAVSALAVACAAAAEPSAGNAAKPDKVVGFRESDAVMNGAIAEARRTLPVFWTLLEKDPIVAASGKIKVGFETPNGPEHMWVRDVRRDGKVVRGVLDNRPIYLTTLGKGDPVTVNPADISDWSYIRDGRMFGSFTTRVMLPHMPAEQRAAYRKFLSDKPLEDERS
jgi:uncharacterized protein YegJ (DUF2314 family)